MSFFQRSARGLAVLLFGLGQLEPAFAQNVLSVYPRVTAEQARTWPVQTRQQACVARRFQTNAGKCVNCLVELGFPPGQFVKGNPEWDRFERCADRKSNTLSAEAGREPAPRRATASANDPL